MKNRLILFAAIPVMLVLLWPAGTSRALPATGALDGGCMDWIERLYAFAGIPCTASLNGVVRSDLAPNEVGVRLMVLNLKTKTARVAWECERCWSPVRVSEDALAVTRPDGVWIIPIRGQGAPRRAYASDGGPPISSLFGLVGDGGSLVALVTGADGGVHARWLDLRTGALDARTGPAVPRGVQRPDQVRGGEALVQLRPRADAPWRVAKQTPAGKATLWPPPDTDDGVSRFDSIWLSGDEISFIEGP